MLGVEELSISFLTDSPILVLLALIVLVALSLYLYRRTNPPLPLYLRIILGGLRTVALLALFLALFEPVLSYTREFVRERRVSVLVDESLSMAKVEDGLSRRQRTDSLLSGLAFENLNRRANVATYFFGGNLGEAPQEVDSARTAIGDALYDLDKMRMAAPDDYWLLLSDGNSNSGRGPVDAAALLTTPVIAVDLSGGEAGFDVGVEDLEFNPVVFAGRPTEIRVRLNWRNAGGRTVTVGLEDSVRTVAQEELSITQEEGIGEVTLRYTPAEPGQKLMKITVPPQDGEETTGNNERSFSVKVLKSRLQILLVAERPDYEVGFMRRLLSQSDKYEITLIATGSNAGNLGGRLPTQQTELNRYDLIILYDPDPAGLGNRSDIFRSYLAERGGAVWVLMGPLFSRGGPAEWFNELLPFYPSGQNRHQWTQFRADPLESHLFHPAIRLADNQSAIREVWSTLPPFESLVRCDAENPNAVILAAASVRGPESAYPAMGYLRHGPGKVFATAVLPFWPWGFVNLGFGEDDSHYRDFIEGTVGWLTVRDDFEPIRVRPEKDVFTRGEPVVFNGFAYDLGYRPIPGAGGSVRLSGGPGEEQYETDLTGDGDGTFQAALRNLPPGTYQYEAVIEKEGRRLKTDRGSILVETFSLEEFDRSGDPATLAAVARATGGNYYTYREFDEAVERLDLETVSVRRKEEIVFWNKLWLLLVVIGALSAEWVLRKANQLV